MSSQLASSNKKKSPVLAAMIGTALEYYDVSLYGFMTPLLISIFLPQVDPVFAYILAFASHPIGLFFRPAGAVTIGWIGDRYGRKKALSIAIFGTAVSTILISCLPTYESIGIAAPILLLSLRVIQNFFQAGEYNGGAIFVLEYQSSGGKGLLSGWYCALTVLGILAAATMTAFVSHLPPEYWRLPFMLGALTGVLGFVVRFYMVESPEFEEQQKQQRRDSRITWYREVMTIFKQPRQFLSIFTVTVFFSALYMLLSMSINALAPIVTTFSKSTILTINAYSLVIYMVALPVGGWLGDRYGINRSMRYAAMTTIILVYPILSLMEHNTIESLLIMKSLFALLCAWYVGPYHAWMQTKFTTEHRYLGISFVYSIASKVGAFMPAISLWVWDSTQQLGWIAMLLMIIGVFAIMGLSSEGTFKSPRSLLREGMAS